MSSKLPAPPPPPQQQPSSAAARWGGLFGPAAPVPARPATTKPSVGKQQPSRNVTAAATAPPRTTTTTNDNAQQQQQQPPPLVRGDDPNSWYLAGSLRKCTLHEDDPQQHPAKLNDLLAWYDDVMLETSFNLTTVVVPEKNTPATVTNSIKSLMTPNTAALSSKTRGTNNTNNDGNGDNDPHFKPVLPPVSIKDFEKFFAITRAKTKTFLENHAPKRRAGAERDWETGFNLPRRDSADTRIPTEEASSELLRTCYATVPDQMFSTKFNAVGESKEVEEVIQVSEKQRQLRQQGGGGGGNDQSDVIDHSAVMEVVKRHTATLEGYVETVEKCLWMQTTTKAETIFQAVSNLHSLQSMVKLESTRVAGLRGSMKQLRDVTTRGREQVLSLHRERNNSSQVKDILDKIKRVAQAKSTCDKLLQGADYMGAFEVIESASVFLQGELAGIQALKSLARQLKETRLVILNEMVEKFVSLASMESQSHDDEDDVGADDVIYHERLRHSLAPLIRGLWKNGILRDALSRHRDKLIHFVNLTGKTLSYELNPAIPAEKKTEYIGELDHAHFVEFLQQTFDALHPVVLHSAAVHAAIDSVLKQIQTQAQANVQQAKANRGGSGLTPQQKDDIRDVANLSNAVVIKVRERAYTVVMKWLGFRDNIHAKISVQEFLTIWNLTHDFINESGGEPALELRSALAKQADRFLTALDERQVASLALLLDNETWDGCNVSRELQFIVDRMAQGAVASREEMDNVLRTAGSTTEAGRLIVGPRALRVTSCCLNVIKYLNEYTRCGILFPITAQRGVQQMLAAVKMYDERTRDLILRAGLKAMGKTNKIGAKHITMASQSLTAVILVLQMCGKILGEYVPPQQKTRVDRDIERTVDDLKAHTRALADKLASLIETPLQSNLGNLERDVDWDAKGVDGLEKPQQYMVRLTDNIVKLHDVVSQNMDKYDVADVFGGIFTLLNTRIPILFENVTPKTPAGRARVRVDISSLLSCCRMLRMVDGPGDTLEVWLEDRYGRSTAWGAGVAGGGQDNGTVESTRKGSQ